MNVFLAVNIVVFVCMVLLSRLRKDSAAPAPFEIIVPLLCYGISLACCFLVCLLWYLLDDSLNVGRAMLWATGFGFMFPNIYLGMMFFGIR